MQEIIKNQPGWKGEIDHKEAEKLLIDKKPGTYLLRKGDSITGIVNESLSEENKTKLECYIMTIVEENQKIEDIMLIKIKNKWIIYHDEPDLIDSTYNYFDTLKDLLSTLKERAKYPL